MRKTLSAVMLVCCFVSSADAGKYDDLAVYFPMSPGTVWTYQMANNPPEWQVRVQDCGVGEDGIHGCSLKSLMLPWMPPRYDIFVIQGDAVLMRATKVADLYSGQMKEWKQSIPSEMVLRSPLKVGTKWENIIDDRQERLKIVSVGKVKVKAGEYGKVIKISKETFDKDPKTGKWKQCMSGDCNFLQYYAPNIGLIKEEMVEGQKTIPWRELVEFTSSNQPSGN